jgi:hypothetical protein
MKYKNKKFGHLEKMIESRIRNLTKKQRKWAKDDRRYVKIAIKA